MQESRGGKNVYGIGKRGVIQLAVILFIAFGLKAWYSVASVNDLWIVVTPTAWLVGGVTGEAFRFESYSGYVNADHTFLIAGACSGINFWIAAFLLLGISRCWRGRESERGAGWLMIPIILLVSYIATIAANTVRISLALMQHREATRGMWFDPAQMHRVEGVFVYFGFLQLLFMVDQRLCDGEARQGFGMRGFLLPLAIYWFTTLGMPLMNGAYHEGAVFWEHAGFVAVIPMLLLASFQFAIAVKSRAAAGLRGTMICAK